MTDNSADFVAEMFDNTERCEIGTTIGDRCLNEARFYAVWHDCGHGLMCAAHVEAFLRQVSIGARAQCKRCGQTFASIDQAVSVVDL